MGAPYTQCSPRWLNHNVAVAPLASKSTLAGKEATSTVGAASGDDQVTWITESTTEDHQNVHVAALSSDLALVSWETLTSPDCKPVPLGCSGTYAGTSFQFVNASGVKVGGVTVEKDVFVGGDMALVGEKLCWPYVDMAWDLSAPKSSGALVTKMSFACASGWNATGSSAAGSSTVVESMAAAASTAISSPSLSLPGKQVQTSAVSSAVASLSTAASSLTSTVGLTTPAAGQTSSAAAMSLTLEASSIPTTFTSVIFPSPTQDAGTGDDDTCI